MTFNSVLNFRDISGIQAYGEKQISERTIYRSANLDKINRSDIKKLHLLNIKTIIDLRAPYERKNQSRTIENIEKLYLTLDFEKTTREKLKPYLYKKNSENEILNISNSLYLEILDASQPAIKQILEILLSDESCPVLIHCQAGKDRTGIICALIQLALRVERQSIIKDYLKSNDFIIPFFRKMLMIRKILSFGFFPSGSILFAITVRQRNIESVLDRVNNHYGGIEAYLRTSGFTETKLAKLRERYSVY
jgi:protein-tyrosine phosphatase